VYIIIIPIFGIINNLGENASYTKLFGAQGMIFSTLSIAWLGFFVWAHHMFTISLDSSAKIFFSAATMLIGIPTSVKIFNWTLNLIGKKIVSTDLKYKLYVQLLL